MGSSRPRAKTLLGFQNSHLLWTQALLIFFVVISAARSDAQQTFQLKVAGHSSQSNEGFQYRYVEIATSNGLPTAKDVSVWCHVNGSFGNWGRSAKLIQPIPLTLKAGDVRVVKELYLPSVGVVSFSLTASDNSRKQLLESPWGNSAVDCHHVLIVDGVGVGESKVTFNRSRRTTQPAQSPISREEIGRYSDGGKQIHLVSTHSKIAYLPKRWIGYSSIKQVIVNSKDLVALNKDPERFSALIQWVTMGGTLIVSECGDDFQCISSLTRYFKDKASGIAPKMTLYMPDEDLVSQCERLSNIYAQSSGTRTIGLAGLRYSADWNEVEGVPGKDGGIKFSIDTEFLLHRFGMGQMIFHTAPVKKKYGKGLLKACLLGIAARQYDHVLGSKNSFGDAFQKWQLLNVGIAPIGLFIFVVLSFMTLIGPVGYSYLKVKQKLNYQVWLVPLISALACLSLIGHAFLSEGVGTKLRPTVYVDLDQHRKVAATFARYSVYSALQPPPYQFGDAQFATLESAGDGAPAVYYWSDDRYRLTGGNASARNVHQVFVATPVKTDSGIEIKPSEDSGASSLLSLTNKFHDPLKLLAVQHNGELYFVIDLASSETKVAVPSADDEFVQSDDVRKLLSELLPTNTQNYRYNPRGRFYNPGSGRSQGGWDVAVKQIDKFRSARGIQDGLEDGHYIAILDSMKEVPSVVPGAREIDGSVIVHGKW